MRRLTGEEERRLKAGGWVPIDVHSPHSIELARFAVNEHNKEAHTHLKFERLVKGESQIVAGVNYRLTINATNGGLIQTYEALVYEGLDHKKVLKAFKVITSDIPPTGGWTPIDVNSLHSIELAKFAVDEHNKQAHTHLKFNRLVSGESQIVAGVNYKLIIKAINGELIQTYEAHVFEALDGQRVLNSFKIITSDIPPTGGWTPIDVHSPHSIELARFAVNEHNKQAHTHLKFERLVSGESQIVAGVNYKLIIKAINGELIQTYEAHVFEALNGERVLNSFTVVITSDIPQPGGWQPVEDVKEVEGIGRFAVVEHNKEAHTHLKFEGVLKGETQIVEGINYRLTIRAINGELIHNYEARVFEDLKGHKNLVSFHGTVAS
ncbi:hypothetical protein Syun_017761 [Stephania yunnanensis]|uniref:Cystatin domain-containing protein n=1 Tax=Stephania yunnanensis TaxID=152371 RepID=A0AAP0P3P0_9MAGN